MFKIEVDCVNVCTCTISDVDEQRIKDYIKSNPEKFKFMSDKEAIVEAVSELEIDLYNDYVESDSYTNDIRWSEFEERSAKEILNGYNHCKSKLDYGNLKIEEQRKYFEEHQQKFKEIIRKYNSGQIDTGDLI